MLSIVTSDGRELKNSKHFTEKVVEPKRKSNNPPPGPAGSDDALALAYATQFAGKALYVSKWKAWVFWDGKRWVRDEGQRAIRNARRVCRRAAEGKDTSVAKTLTSKKTIANVEFLARSDKKFEAASGSFDQEPLLLNTPKGIVDLKTGEMSDHDPDYRMTKITAVAPGGECPRWREFLKQITLGDKFLERYLKRLCGYFLTGSVEEHVLAFLIGNGANGKSTFIETVKGVMGDYAQTIRIELLLSGRTEVHTTEIADLLGARFVSAVESKRGAKWNDERVKMLTGGDTLRARRLYESGFELKPTFKIAVVSNNKPVLSKVDEAIVRRLNLVPFDLKIPRNKRDPGFADKVLKPEWPGILQWMIDGCREWKRIGLKPPNIVKSTTKEYFRDQDTIGLWLDERTEAKNYYSSVSLYADYKQWVEQRGEFPLTQKEFSGDLQGRGFESKRIKQATSFIGLQLVNLP